MLALALLLAQPQLDRPLGRDGLIRVADAPTVYSRFGLLYMRLKAAEAAGGDGETEAAVDRILARLAAAQRPDGLWSDGAPRDEVAVTSFALLAFAGAGYETATAPYAETVRRALRRLLEIQEPSGAWGRDVRDLALATAALAAVQRRRPSFLLDEPLARASACLDDRRVLEGGDSAVILWVQLTRHSPFTYPRPRLASTAPEHAAFMAFTAEGPRGRTWRAWFAEARPRLLKEVDGVEAIARQAIDLETPYRFVRLVPNRFGARFGL